MTTRGITTMELAVEIPAATPCQPYRYRIPGLDALALELSPGDSVQVSSVDGAQACEWLLLPPGGREGEHGVAQAGGAQAGGAEVAEAETGELADAVDGLTLARYASITCLEEHAFASQPQGGEEGKAEQARSPFTQQRLAALGVAQVPLSQWQRLSVAGLPAEIRWPREAPAARLILLAPGDDMQLDGKHLATELEVSHFCGGLVGQEQLPAPLAPIKQETRASAGTVEVYEVKQG
jgi:aminomethyltransferase